MYLVEQQERLAAAAAAGAGAPPATNAISWGRHDAKSAALRSSIKGAVAGRPAPLSLFRTIISPTTELSIRSLIMMLGAPTVATLFLHACQNYQCALTPSVGDAWAAIKNIDSVPQAVAAAVELPLRWFSWRALGIYVTWYLTQAVLYAVVPAKIGYGQKTLAGHELPYKVNGFTCYVLSHLAFFAAVYLDIIPISIIAQNWFGLFVAVNMGGYALTLWAYYKAHYFPSHADDRKFSGSMWYDMFMGIEFNPRIGELWDYKLFHNGRPGIIAWTLIDISFCFSTTSGKFTLPSIPQALVLFLHAVYVIDYFWHEDWYLRTIDIAHDHFGFYLAWGDLVWLPYMYTVQAQYLHYNQDRLVSSPLLNLVIFCLGVGGYTIFRGSNNQKDFLRRQFSPQGKELTIAEIEAVKKDLRVWGKPPTFIRAPYQTADGKTHHAMLLTCGYWGVARHLNYCGDIMMATAMGLATLSIPGGPAVVGWWYTAFLTTLLIHRTRRCDVRCEMKYGDKWEEYRRTVRWRILPGVY